MKTIALLLWAGLNAVNAGNPGYSFNGFKQSKPNGVVQPMGDTEPKVTNGGVNLFPYTPDIRAYIVQAHNRARATLLPGSASNMREVSWNEQLAIEASELVNTCVFAHSTENYAYGQNLVVGNPVIDKPTVDSWMTAWVTNEISAADRAGNGYMDLDHASAVLWAKTYYVGCASKKCPNGYLTACNYFQQGNIVGEQTFIPGPPCSRCPPQAPFCDASGKLCTANKSGYQKVAQYVTPSPSQALAPAPAARVPGSIPVPSLGSLPFGARRPTPGAVPVGALGPAPSAGPAGARGPTPASILAGVHGLVPTLGKTPYSTGNPSKYSSIIPSKFSNDPAQYSSPSSKSNVDNSMYKQVDDNSIKQADAYPHASSSSGSGSANGVDDITKNPKTLPQQNSTESPSQARTKSGVLKLYPDIHEYVMCLLVLVMLT